MKNRADGKRDIISKILKNFIKDIYKEKVDPKKKKKPNHDIPVLYMLSG